MYKTKKYKKEERKATLNYTTTAAQNFFLPGHIMHHLQSMLTICLAWKTKQSNSTSLFYIYENFEFTFTSSRHICFNSFDSCLALSQFSSVNLLLQICMNFKKNFTRDVIQRWALLTTGKYKGHNMFPTLQGTCNPVGHNHTATSLHKLTTRMQCTTTFMSLVIVWVQ